MNWDTLPNIVLSNIFKHLCNNDRYRAALVCKSWSNAFRSPVLWRKMRFDFPLPLYNKIFDEKPFKFVKSMGDYLHELEISCSGLDKRNNVESLHNFMDFLLILTLKPPSLKKFTFTNLALNFSWKNNWRKRKVEALVQDFFTTQSNLTYFDMFQCRATLEMGLNILSLLAKKNSTSLKNLRFEDFFTQRCTVLSSPDCRYHNVMSSFKSLVELNINYSYIDSNVLENIARNCSHSLKVIEIVCSDTDRKDHVIPNTTWSLVREVCPQLEVHVKIKDITHGLVSDYIHIIPSEMGLNSFNASCDTCQYNVTDTGLNAVVMQLCHFGETLETVLIYLVEDQNFDDRSLILLVTSCRKLKSLFFEGSWTTRTMKELCEMQLKGKIHLEVCDFVIPLNLSIIMGNEESNASMDEIRELHKLILAKQGVKFTFIDNYSSDSDT